MIRRLVKTAICEAAAWARLDAWMEAKQPVVIGYHRVLDHDPGDDVMPGLWISLSMLERHLDWIGRRSRFVTLDELGAIVDSGETPGSVVAVTFDDGYVDIEQAFAMLGRKGIPAAVFVVSDAVDGGDLLLHDRCYRAMVWLLQRENRPLPPDVEAHFDARRRRLDPYRLTSEILVSLDREQLLRVLEAVEADAGGSLRDGNGRSVNWATLQALHAAGATIGSHTRTHAKLPGAERAHLEEEVAGSRRQLEEGLGIRIRHFAYPGGLFDDGSVEAVERAGYRFAYTACRHRDPARPALTIPRTMLWERSSLGLGGSFSGAVLSCQVHGALRLLDRCPGGHGAAR